MTINAVGSSLAVSLNFIQGEITAITQYQIAWQERQLRCGGQVVLAVRVDGKADEAVVQQVVGGLDAGIANAGLGVGHTGKISPKMAGEFDDRAVLNEHPAIAAE